jgi:hypothetical protein
MTRAEHGGNLVRRLPFGIDFLKELCLTESGSGRQAHRTNGRAGGTLIAAPYNGRSFAGSELPDAVLDRRAFSASFRSTSRTKACRYSISDVITFLKHGSAQFMRLSTTAWVTVVSFY